MPAAKRRKVAASAIKTPAPNSRGITAFTKVIKTGTTNKTLHTKLSPVPPAGEGQDTVLSKKRKATAVDIETSSSIEDDAPDTTTLSRSSEESNREIKPSPQQAQEQATDSTLATRIAHEVDCDSSDQLESLPAELLDLINLHSSFLTALSLHYAHNGTHTPADLRILCPDVGRAWGKRKVLINDIRRLLALQSNTSNTSNTFSSQVSSDSPTALLSLSDYGNGKICVEINCTIEQNGGIRKPLDENRLNDTYAEVLRTLWKSQGEQCSSATAFINHLKLEPIAECSSLSKISPLLARGQRRLEGLRAGTVQCNLQPNKSKINDIKPTNSARPSLLERLKTKQILLKSLPAAPTKLELDRNSALQRLEEVVAVLTLLSTSTSSGQSRTSFTMPTVLGKLRDSFKTPLSKEEGEACVKLLAEEIAPEWLEVVVMGKVHALVLRREHKPDDKEISGRIMKLST